jgi:hypothetical protein
MSSEKIAEEIIKSMGSQMDLLFALSVAICGGIIALLVQMALRDNQTRTESIEFQGFYLFILTFIFEGLSVIFGYFARGSITSSIPRIYSLDFSKIESWGSAEFEGHCTLKWLFRLQFGTFMIGIVLLFILLIINRRLIGES